MKLNTIFFVILFIATVISLVNAAEPDLMLDNKRICLSEKYALVGVQPSPDYAMQLNNAMPGLSAAMPALAGLTHTASVQPIAPEEVVRKQQSSQQIRQWLLTGNGAELFDWGSKHTTSHLMTVLNEQNVDTILALIDQHSSLEARDVGIAVSFNKSPAVIDKLIERTSNYDSTWFDSLSGHEHSILTQALAANNLPLFKHLYKKLGGLTNHEQEIVRLMSLNALRARDSAETTSRFLDAVGAANALDTSANIASGSHFLDEARALIQEKQRLMQRWENAVIGYNKACISAPFYLNKAYFNELKAKKLTKPADIVTYLRDKNLNPDALHAHSRAYSELLNLRRETPARLSEEELESMMSLFTLLNEKRWVAVKLFLNELRENNPKLLGSALANIAMEDFPPEQFDAAFKAQLNAQPDFIFTLYKLGALPLIMRIQNVSELPLIFDEAFKSNVYLFLNSGGDPSLLKHFVLADPDESNLGLTYQHLLAGHQ